jgi:hypothetical protein
MPRYGIEPLLMEYNVDLALWAHEHNYERLYPIYDYEFDVGDDPYFDPKFPVHVTSGSAVRVTCFITLFWVINPLCLSSSSAFPFFQLFFSGPPPC